MSTNKKIAIKFEGVSNDRAKPVLFYDQQFLYFLSVQNQCEYVPKFYSYGGCDGFNYLAMQICGPNIGEIQKAAWQGQLSVPTVTHLAYQMLIALSSLHKLRIVHRDLKPDNYCWGTLEDPNTIKLLDFGLSKQYKSCGKHIPMRFDKDLTGTARYVSINTHKGLEQSRRDDLEALSYVITYLFKGGKLPWIGIHVSDRNLHFKKILEKKMTVDLYMLCDNCPTEMVDFITYCRNLQFDQDPSYTYLVNLLENISYERSFSLLEVQLDWVQNPTFKMKLEKEFKRINYFRN